MYEYSVKASFWTKPCLLPNIVFKLKLGWGRSDKNESRKEVYCVVK